MNRQPTFFKLFSTIAFISWMAWSLCACSATKTVSPTLPLQASATPPTVTPSATDSPTQTAASTTAAPTITPPGMVQWVNSGMPITLDNVAEVKLLRTIDGFQGKVWTVAFSGDGTYLASSDRDSIDVWDAVSSQHAFAFPLREVDLNGFIFSPDSRLLASGQTIWDIESQQPIHKFNSFGIHPAFSPDGAWLAVSGGRPINIWDVASGELVRTFEAQADNDSFNIVFSPDGTLLADSGHLGRIRLWDVASGQITRTLTTGTHNDVHDIAFSPDGKWLVSVGTDYAVRLWDIASGQAVHTMSHFDGLYGVAFSWDGKLVASASCDRTVKLWDVASGKLLATLRHGDEVTSVAFSPDGTMLASGNYDSQIYLWGIPRAVPILAPTPTISNSVYLQVFEEVWSTIDQTYFDPEFGGLDWEAVHAKYKPLIIAAEDDEELYQLLNQMLWELKVSHAAVGPADQWPAVEPMIFMQGEIGIDVRLLDNRVVITHLKAGSPAEKAGLRPGFIIQKIEAASVGQIIADAQKHLAPPYNDQSRKNIITNRLLSLIYGEPGTCVKLAYLDEKDGLHEDCIERIQRPRVSDMTGILLPPFHLEFESQRLASGVGYIRFNTFHPGLLPDLVAAVAILQDAPGIIIDLRSNPGGDPSVTYQLAAQFLDGQVLFSNWRIRTGTMPRLVTGENVYTGPVVILIDILSYSASEEFSSGMQAVGRAVIIGERSPGGASAMNITTLSNGAILGYPVAQLQEPDGTVVEGRGVIPDITVSLERSQLLEGIDAQLQAAIHYIVETVR